MPGFALRQVTLRTEVNEEGNSTVLRISREITKIRIGPVSASMFVLPEDYKEAATQVTEYHRYLLCRMLRVPSQTKDPKRIDNLAVASAGGGFHACTNWPSNSASL
jgi:hypothetical protein